LFYYLSSPVAERFLLEKKSTTSYPVFGMAKARNMLIPLPPFAEQKRIVKKLEQLIRLCDELKATIADSQKHSEKLLQQILSEAFTTNELEIA
jgi:type I restriction enzyme S subunit